MKAIGGRKMLLGLIYLVGCFTISAMAVNKGVVGFDAAGVASLFASIAVGLGVIVWGNVQSKLAQNGKVAK